MRQASGKKLYIAITAVILAVLLCGCISIAGTQATGGNAFTKAQANVFLTQSKANIETITKAVEDTSAFLSDASLDNETQMQSAVTTLQGIRDTLAPVLKNETAAKTQDIEATYGKAEKSCAGKTDDVLGELQGLLSYISEFLKDLTPLASASASDYAQVSQLLTTANEQMKAVTPPSFLKYMHEGISSVFADYLSDIQYMQASEQINDQLRINSGTYRVNVIERKMNSLLDEMTKGFDRRKTKIEGDVEQIKTLLADMSAWVDGNTAVLQKDTKGDTAAVMLEALPASLTDNLNKTKINCTYEAQDTIIPANYRSLDYVVYLSAWSDNGDSDVMVSVEIPDFTQKYEQKLTLGRAETQIKIHPPLLEGAAKSLNSSKDAQININVTDISTGKPVLQETHPLKILSRYDMQWEAADGSPYYENILAWLTPEAPEVKELLRSAADSISEITSGGITFIGGYQSVSGFDNTAVTANQAVAVMNALAGAKDVKYVATPFSSSDNTMQRVATPAEVINQRSGLCIETAVTVASALQATNMHAALIILPTHAQVALETWEGSGEYYLIETTALEDAKAGNWDNVIRLLTNDEWAQYITDNKCTIIDCDMAQTLGIKSID